MSEAELGALTPVQIAVVGMGNAGRQHVAALAGGAPAEVLAVVEPDPDAAARTELPVRSLPAVLADPQVEVVALCVPPGQRVDLVEAAVAAGKHVVVEKPPARGVAELELLLTTVRRADRLAAVMFQHRFVLPESLRAGAPERFAGAAASLIVSRSRSATHYAGTDWRSRPDEAVGGVTAHLGVHYLDIACQLLGTPVEVRPLARVDAAPGIDTQLAGHVSFASGAQLTVVVTSRSVARFEQLTILGADSWLEIDGGRLTGVLSGTEVRQDPRPAAALRTAVYREMAGAVRGQNRLDVAALERSAGVTAILDGLLTPAVVPA